MRTPWRDQISRLTLRNCLGHWRYSLVTALIVAIGLVSIWMFRGYIMRVASLYREHYTARLMYGQVLIETAAAAGSNELTAALDARQQEEVRAFIAQDPSQVAQTVRFLALDGQLNLGAEASVFSGLAYDTVSGEAVRGAAWRWNAVAGRPLQGRSEVMIGRNMAELLGCTYDSEHYLKRHGAARGYTSEERPFICSGASGAKLKPLLSVSTERGQLSGAYFALVGLMDVGYRDIDRTWLMLDLQDAQKLLATDRVSWFSLALAQPAEASAMVERFGAYSAAHHLDLRAYRWDEHPSTDIYRRTMAFFSFYENFVLVILITIVSIAVFNIMMKVAMERRHEIGLMRALGYRTADLLRLLLGESCLNTLAGLLMGTVAAFGLTALVNNAGVLYRAGVLSEPVAFAVDLSLGLWLGSASLLFAIAMLSSLVALLRALRLSVIECLIA